MSGKDGGVGDGWAAHIKTGVYPPNARTICIQGDGVIERVMVRW